MGLISSITSHSAVGSGMQSHSSVYHGCLNLETEAKVLQILKKDYFEF